MIAMSPQLHDRVVAMVRHRFPVKSFGYFLTDLDRWRPTDVLLFEGANLRNDRDWQPEFHAYGDYFVEHDDAGFVATPEESWQRQKEIWARGLEEVGVFHTHQRHPANFSLIDYEMHVGRLGSLWHMIISLRNPEQPQLRAFDVVDGRVRELAVVADPEVPVAP